MKYEGYRKSDKIKDKNSVNMAVYVYILIALSLIYKFKNKNKGGCQKIGKLVSSSEGWCGVTKDQYRTLEQVDEMLLMNLFQVPKSVPRLSLYIECAKLPVRFVCQARRLLYNWHILQLEES